MSVARDEHDLFGDSDNDGSLFGDGDDGGSLFGDDAGNEMSVELLNDAEVHEARTVAPSLTLPMKADQPISRGLTLPNLNGPDPLSALSSSYVGHTSGHQVVSTPNHTGNEGHLSLPSVQHPEAVVDGQASSDQCIDTFAMNSHGDQTGHDQSGQSSQSSSGLASDTDMWDAFNERQLEHDLMQELDRSEDCTSSMSSMSSMSSTSEDQHQFATLGVDKIDFRYSKCATYRGVRLPRHVDLDESGVKFLTPYVNLRRNDSCKLHYERLELPGDLGPKLSKDLRTYIDSSEEFLPLLKKGMANPSKRRGDYLRVSIGLLQAQGWGDRWFGPLSETGQDRKLLWPAESTLITLRFVSLVYKFVDQAKYSKTKKQVMRARVANTPALSQFSLGTSQVSPIDLTLDEEDDYMSQGLILTPATSASPSRPVSSHVWAKTHPYFPPLPNPTPPASYAPMSAQEHRSPVLSDLPSPTVQEIDRKVMTTPGTDTISSANGGPLLTPSDEINTVDQLAEHIATIKRRKLQPATTEGKVVYRFFFVDNTDGGELCSPMKFEMSASIVQGDVVANLKAALSKAGSPAHIYIHTPAGYREIQELREWKEAVHTVWSHHGDGTSVTVAIHI